MASPVTVVQLQNASADTQTIEQVVNGSATATVTTRLGTTVPTLLNAIMQLINTKTISFAGTFNYNTIYPLGAIVNYTVNGITSSYVSIENGNYGIYPNGSNVPAGQPNLNWQLLAAGAQLTAVLSSLLQANAGATVTGGLTVDSGTATGNFTVLGDVISNSGTTYSYPNTDGVVFGFVDSNGALLFGIREDQSIFSPGQAQLPVGSTSTASLLSIPSSFTVGGNLTVSGTLSGQNFSNLPYPNTDGIVFAFLDASGQIMAWLDETGALISAVSTNTNAPALVTVTPEILNTSVTQQNYYQSTDSSGNPQIATLHAVTSTTAHTQPAETLLTSAGKNFFPALNTDGTVNFISSRTGNNRRFKMNADGSGQFYEELQKTYAQFANGAPTTHHILMTGQSLSTGNEGVTQLSTTQPFANTMFYYSGSGGNQGVNTNVNGASGVTTTPLTALATETVANGMADSITSSARSVLFDNPSGLKSYDILYSGSGIANTTYLGLCGPTDDPPSGTASYQEFVAQIKAGKQLAGASNYVIPCMVLIHGESDDNATLGPVYYTALQHWHADLQAAIQANTTQTNTVPFLLSQTCAWAAYSQVLYPHTALAQLQAAINFPQNFIMVGPEYYLIHSTASGPSPHVTYDQWGDGGAHLVADGYRWLGEQFGKVFRRVFLEGQQWLPFTPLAITRTGKVIAIDMHVPVGPIVFDTVHISNPGNYGFEYADGGNSATIQSVALDPVIPNRINITLNTTPTGTGKVVRYAYTATNGTGNDNNGPGLGPRGCVRDSDATVSYYNASVTCNMLTAGQPYPLWNWLTTFSYNIN